MRKRGYGLGLIPPSLRLILVGLSTSALVLVTNPYHALAALLVGILLLFLSPAPKWLLVFIVACPTMLFYFMGNFAFSPPSGGGLYYAIFRFNSLGLELGMVRAMRIGAILCISLSCLFSTTLTDLYEAFAPIPRVKDSALIMVRGIQIARRDFILIAQSLKIRGMKWYSLRRIVFTSSWGQLAGNVKTFVGLLRTITPRLFKRIAQGSTAWESHHVTPKAGTGKVECRGLFVRYGKNAEDALEDINLDVDPGEFIYVAGPDGAGKSTLLLALSGIIPRITGYISGEVVISGVNISDLRLREIGSLIAYVGTDPQSSILGLTVSQEIMLFSKGEKKARECLALMGIEHLWDRETTKLSGGEQVRLILAGLLARGTSVVALDAPLDELDPAGRLAFTESLHNLRTEKNVTIFIADPFYSRFRGDITRVIALERGRFQGCYGPEVLQYESYLSRWGLGRKIAFLQSKATARPQIVAKMTNVHVTLDGNKILKGIDLLVHRSEFVAIVGPNGSGKTTAMLTLAGVIRPDKKNGSVVVNGNIGYVYQDASLQVIAHTSREEVCIAPRLRGHAPADIDRLAEAQLKWAGLSGAESPLDLHSRLVKMLAIAAMAIDIDLLILDEPTIYVDGSSIDKIMTFVFDLLAKGKTVIAITHDEQIAALADKVLIFNDGRTVREERKRENRYC
jgi:energy-coupling factor transporter ATP-binding protein EcfA2